MSVAVRTWTRADVPAVRTVLWETWEDAYRAFIPPEDLRSYFDAHYSETELAKHLNDPLVVGMVAEVDGSVAGYARTHFNPEEGRLYLQQLYILPRYQGSGIGGKLMRVAAERAKSLRLDCVWLGVMSQNTPALEWYRRHGFKAKGTAPFTMGTSTVEHVIGYVPVTDIEASPERQERQ